MRTAGKLAWHITTSVIQMAHRTGLNFEAIDENSQVPATVKEIYDTYKNVSEKMISEIKEKWDDETLLIEDDMFGEKWSKWKTLGVLITHQIHHRGQ